MTPRLDLGRIAALLAGAGLIAGCAQPPGGTSPAPTPKAGTQAPAATPAPSDARAPVELPPPPPPPPLPPHAVQKAVGNAIELLEAGNEDQAAIELQRVLQTDPGHKLAQSLMRQIKDDPLTALGRESFTYRVQPGESLSKIAGRFLNDVHLFYILARYNDIKVPRQLAGGQLIRLPGKAPPAVALPPAPAPAPIAKPAPAPAPAGPDPAVEASAQAARQRAEAVTRHTRAARAAFAKQDLNGAIRAWDSVLELDPNNRTAQLERQKAIDLKERLTKVK